jgi:predicted TPR repeat methyltransferase
MLSIAQSKYPYKKLIKYDIEQGLLNLFPREKFDIIITIGVLEFTKNIQKVLGEMKQLLKTGGIIAFTYEIYEPKNKYGIAKVSTLGSASENSPELLNFKVYRRKPSEIENILNSLSLKIIGREQFIGYLRSQLKIPVPYELLIAKH